MSTNNIIAQMGALSSDKIQKEQREKYKADMQADIDVSNAGYDSQISNTQEFYNKQIDDEKTAYDSEYQKNAVQKQVNEMKIAQNMANLGLTDSGLNRTQQTAVQLSYANQKGKIDLARQSALDDLTLQMTDAITTLKNKKAAAARDITNQWNSYADTQAQNIYNTQYNGLVDAFEAQAKANADVQKAAISASAKAKENENNKTLWYYTGTYDEDKNPIFRNSGGKTQAFGDGINPYTSDNNKKYVITDKNGNIVTKDESVLKVKGTDTQKAAAYYGVCSNGYQPKGVIINGEKQGTIKAYDEIPDDNEITGKKQNVWYTKETGKYWIWYGEGNTYVEVELIDGNWTVI